MKNINWKNIVRAAAGMLLLAVFITYQNNVDAKDEPCNLSNAYLHSGGNSSGCAPGVLDLSQLELAPKALQTLGNLTPIDILPGFTGLGYPSIFRQAGTSIFDDVIAFDNAAFGPMFVNYGSFQTFSLGDSQLQVNGAIQIQGKTHNDPSGYIKACVNDFGVLDHCLTPDDTPSDDTPSETYNWEIGNWGSCTGESNGSCSGTFNTNEPGSCSGTYQDITRINWNGEDYNWNLSASYYSTNLPDGRSVDIGATVQGLAYTSAGSCYRLYVGGDNTWKYDEYYSSDGRQFGDECFWDNSPMNRNNSLTNSSNPNGSVYKSTDQSCTDVQAQGGGVDQELCESQQYDGCTWDSGTTTNSCAGPTTSSSCTNQNGACSWSDGTEGTQTRKVVCKNSRGEPAGNSLCPDPDPEKNQSCTQ
jgi:hypothetical protein